MAEPVLRVKLTAEGIAEVIAALERVRSEAAKTADATNSAGKNAAAGFLGFNGILAASRGLLAQVGIVLGAKQLFDFAANAVKGAEGLGKLAHGLGASIENITALSVAAHLSGEDIATLGKPLVRFVANVVSESAKAKGALDALGFSAKEIRDLKAGDSVEMLAKISQKFDQLPDGPKKTAAAYFLFRGEAAALIPVMNRLGAEGLDGAKAKANELGAAAEDLNARTSAMNEQFRAADELAKNLAIQFVDGLAPSLQTVVEAMFQTTKGGSEGWRKLGEVVGVAIQTIAFAIAPLVTLFTGVTTAFADFIGGSVALFRKALSGDLKGAGQEYVNRWKLVARDINNATDTALKQIDQLSPTNKPPGKQFGPLVPKTGTIDITKLTKQKSDAVRAGIDADLAYLRASLKIREDAEDRSFKRGLITIADHFAERRRILEDGLAKEVALLQKRELAEARAGDKKGFAKTVGEIKQAHARAAGDQAKLGDEEVDAVRAFESEQAKINAQTLDLQGKRHSAAILGLHDLDEEIKREQNLLDLTVKRGGDISEPVNRLTALQDERNVRKQTIDYEQASRDLSTQLNELSRARTELQDKENAGLLSHIDAQKQIADLEEARLPRLRELASALLDSAKALGNPESIAAAKDLIATIDGLSYHVQTLKSDVQIFGANLKDSLGSNLATELDQINSKTQFWRELLFGVVSDLRKIYSQLLANRLIAGISSLLGGVTPHEGARIQLQPTGKATGGRLKGPGTGTSDSILFKGSVDEFVVRSQVTREPEALPLLEDFNQRGMVAIREWALRRAYVRAAGPDHLQVALDKHGLTKSQYGDMLFNELNYQVNPISQDRQALESLEKWRALNLSSVSGSQRLEGAVSLALEEGLVASHIRQPKGEKAVLEVIAKNPRSIRGALGLR